MEYIDEDGRSWGTVNPWQGDDNDGPACCYCGFAKVDSESNDGECDCESLAKQRRDRGIVG